MATEGASKDSAEGSKLSEERTDDASRIAPSSHEQQVAEGSRQSTSATEFKVPQLPTRAKQTKSKDEPKPIEDEEDEDLDAPPQFPLPDSFQRSKAPASKQPSSSVPEFSFQPPSPPRDEDDEPPSDLNIAVTPGTIPLGNMPPPPSTTSKPAFGMQDGSSGSSRKRAKVALGPGYSPLDWARLTQSGRNLRGVEGPPMRVTLEELKKVRHLDQAKRHVCTGLTNTAQYSI